MHPTHGRYFQERERHDLALRMIRHEARTCTIRACTGLTDDRIRRLYKLYACDLSLSPVRRRRGKSPRQIAFFVRTTQAQFESSLLASLFISFGLLPSEVSDRAPSVQSGALLCDAFETYRELLNCTGITFEHAWFLLDLLNRDIGLRMARCRQCDGIYLQEQQSVLRRPCPLCTLKRRAVRPRRGPIACGARTLPASGS